MRTRLLLSLAAVVLLGACSTVTVGHKFDLKAFTSKVDIGRTTQGQVRGWLGAPESVGMVVESRDKSYEEWTYYHATGRLPTMSDARLKILRIKFDSGGVVHSYDWSGGNE